MDAPSPLMQRVLSGSEHRLSYLLACVLLILPAMTWGGAISLSTSNAVATGGYYQLKWQGGAPAGQFQLEESRSKDFLQTRELYRGAQTASVVSGRADGEYHYRIRQLDAEGNAISDWSEPLQVTVAHHSLARAFAFFAIGLVVFVITLVAIVRGSRAHSD